MGLVKWAQNIFSKKENDPQPLTQRDYSCLLELYEYRNKRLITELYTNETDHAACKYFAVDFELGEADKEVLQEFLNNGSFESCVKVERILRIIGRTIDKWYKDNEGKVVVYYPVKGTQNYEGGYISDGWVLTLKEDRFVLEAEVRLLKDED